MGLYFGDESCRECGRELVPRPLPEDIANAARSKMPSPRAANVDAAPGIPQPCLGTLVCRDRRRCVEGDHIPHTLGARALHAGVQEHCPDGIGAAHLEPSRAVEAW